MLDDHAKATDTSSLTVEETQQNTVGEASSATCQLCDLPALQPADFCDISVVNKQQMGSKSIDKQQCLVRAAMHIMSQVVYVCGWLHALHVQRAYM